MHFSGIIIGATTFIIIGLFHPIIVKSYYYFGIKCWWAFFITGLICLIATLFVENIVVSSLLGVLSFNLFWCVKEVYEQRERVKKGWFPKNPKRKED